MRPIKFRAWIERPNNNPDEKPVMKYEAEYWAGFGDICTGHTKNIILMQFTGLHDKTGKEIWEGDVVRWNEEFSDSGIEERISEVKYQGHGFFPMCAPYFESIKNCEVLGNVHEHPELLAVKSPKGDDKE